MKPTLAFHNDPKIARYCLDGIRHHHTHFLYGANDHENAR